MLDDDVLIRSELITHTDIKKPASPVGFFVPVSHHLLPFALLCENVLLNSFLSGYYRR